ncbi:diguanylate cyclase [Clostridiales bacterium FE2011]|nr:diguanylate cyclase [Clostridiales bacterium FE2011]
MAADWVIVVDDDRNDQRLACEMLRRAGIQTSAMRSGAAALDYIRKGGMPDLILLDVNMPGTDGFETLRLLREQMDPENEIPVVLMTGEEEQEVRGLEEGAMDIIRKPLEGDVVISRVCKALDISRRMKRFARTAEIDQMTDLLNKSATESRMERLCDEEEGLLCVLDLDNFKAVNDTYGHDVGDQVLMMFARILKVSLRRDDECGRIGGDEFVVFLKNMQDTADLDRFTGRINKGYELGAKPILGDKMKITIGVSVGAVTVPQCGRDYSELFRMADQALYEVKQNGKHGARLYVAPAKNRAKAKEEMNLEGVTRMLQERAAIPGALWTGKDIFGSIYQYMMRYMNRYRNSAFRVLLTLQPATDTSDTERRKLREEFRQRIRGALRGSDVMMGCTDNQVFLLLPGIKEQDIERVIGRLLKRWKEAENNDHATISVEYGEIDVGRKTYRRE